MAPATRQHLTGNEAIVRAAVRMGCNFVAARPTTTTGSILAEFGNIAPGTGTTVLQTDDETAAMSRCIGAATAGAKAMTATATPRLGLCGEEIGRAQMNEVPLVIVHCQHLAPLDPGTAAAAGDGDVTLARHLTSGSFPLPVLAASDVASTYRLTCEAFNLAERLRTPVILLTSKDIALSVQSAELARINVPSVVGRHLRAAIDAADAEAGITHMCRKIRTDRQRLEFVQADADPDAETLLISYGLADRAARQAVARVREAGARVSHLTIHSLWPLPEGAIRRAMTPCVRRVLLPELNVGLYAGELCRIIKAVKIESILRYDGRQLDAELIARRVTDWPCG